MILVSGSLIPVLGSLILVLGGLIPVLSSLVLVSGNLILVLGKLILVSGSLISMTGHIGAISLFHPDQKFLLTFLLLETPLSHFFMEKNPESMGGPRGRLMKFSFSQWQERGLQGSIFSHTIIECSLIYVYLSIYTVQSG